MADTSSGPTRRRPAASDAIGTALVGIVGAAALVIGLGYGFLRESGEVGAGFLPVVIGAFIFVASLAELARMYFFAEPVDAGAMSLAETAEKEADTAIADNKPTESSDSSGRIKRERNLSVLKVFGLLLAALLLIPVIGLLLSLTAMVLAIVLWVERKPLVPAVLTAAGMLGFAYLLFVQFLGVLTPQGMLGLM